MLWFRDEAATSEGRALLNRIWEEQPEDEAKLATDFGSILNSIHHNINVKQAETLIQNAGSDLSRSIRRTYILRFIRNAAAIILLPVLGLGLFYSLKYYSARSSQASTLQAFNEVFSSFDAITKVTLPDGSKVWLNHSSSLRYPANFSVKSREVELVGEGYFEVMHDPKSPFKVGAGEIEIIAHGTSFNVMAYPEEDKIETSLIDGSVELIKSLPGEKRTSLSFMNPKDYAVYYKGSDEVIKMTISDERYFSWKDGKLIFTAEPLGEVVKKLSRWYNVDIQMTDPRLSDLTLTATFVHETLPQVMGLLAIITPVDYKISERKMNGDGTFSRTEVILSYRNR